MSLSISFRCVVSKNVTVVMERCGARGAGMPGDVEVRSWCVCVRVLGNVWGLLSVVDWRDIFSWSWMVVRAWDMGMLAQMVVVLVRFECLLKDWFEDGCCQKNVNWGCVWDAVPIACSQGCFSLFLLCVSYCCCARCAWSRGCRSMYRSEADFSDETHLCYLLRHLSTSDVCLSDVLFSVCFWNHNVTMMNWMPKCNSWNFLVCQKCCFGCWALWCEHFFLQHVSWRTWGVCEVGSRPTSNMSELNVSVFLALRMRVLCCGLICVFELRLGHRAVSWRSSERLFHHLYLRLCKAKFRRLCWKFFVLWIGKSYFIVTGAHPRSSLANKVSCFLFETISCFFVAVSCQVGWMLDPASRFSGVGLWCEGFYFCHVVWHWWIWISLVLVVVSVAMS